MTKALGPNGEQVDVRRDGAYQAWHRRARLTCMVCAQPAHVYMRPSTDTYWVRHNGSRDEQRCSAVASGPEGYEHVLLKYWVRDRLRGLGYDAECERRIESTIPDVRTVGSTRKLAVEVQLAHIPLEEARRRTEAVQAEGYQLLWLTHHCHWVARLPAVGLHVEQDATKYSTTQIEDRFYSVKEGVLQWTQEQRMAGGRRRPSLDSFIDQYATGAVQWACQDNDRYGRAVRGDWEKHLKWQGQRISELEKELSGCHRARQQLLTQHEEQQRRLDSAGEELATRNAQVQEMADQIGMLRKERADVVSRAEQWQSRTQTELRGSWWGRRAQNASARTDTALPWAAGESLCRSP